MLTHHATSSVASSQTFTPSFALQHQPQSLATAQELQLLMVTPIFLFSAYKAGQMLLIVN